MTVTIWSAAGLFGVALYLVAYGALQFGLIRGRSVTYTILNLVAACAVLASLTEAFNLPAALVQMSWIALSLAGLARMAWLRTRVRFSEEERRFLSAHFATMAPHLARGLLGLGRWQSASPGTILTRQGAPVHALIYIAGGAASVRAHGAEVARLGPGALIGEMAVMHGGAATADVEVTETARIFALPRADLLREVAVDPDFALALSHGIQIEAQRKIDAANRNRAGSIASGAG